jgi:hypothetical protein
VYGTQAFSLLLCVGDGGYVQPFFDGTAAPSPVSPITPKVKMHWVANFEYTSLVVLIGLITAIFSGGTGTSVRCSGYTSVGL